MKKDLSQDALQPLFTPAVQAQLKQLCSEWQIDQLALFGSALRSDFRTDSDVDLLIEFRLGQEPSYFQLVQLQAQLEAILTRQVDIVTRKGLLNSLNVQRAQAILSSCRVLDFDGLYPFSLKPLSRIFPACSRKSLQF